MVFALLLVLAHTALRITLQVMLFSAVQQYKKLVSQMSNYFGRYNPLKMIVKILTFCQLIIYFPANSVKLSSNYAGISSWFWSHGSDNLHVYLYGSSARMSYPGRLVRKLLGIDAKLPG